VKRRFLLLGAGLAVVAGAYLVVPLGLRQLDFFQVRQVEIVGVRYLSPERVLTHIGIESDRNVFASLRELDRRAEAVPGVARADVRRRLPGTLQFVLEERMPVAFARGESGLVALDESSRPLPYDPSATSFDLPIVERPDSLLTEALALIRQTDPALFGMVDGVRWAGRQTVVVELGDQQLLLRARPKQSEIRAAETVRRHLLQEGRAFWQLDARFQGLIVVRRGEA
jgi:cell division septal protein FtsQ